MMADLRVALRDLSLEGLEETDFEIGRGAYGVVKRYLFKGLRCAGKSIHDEFIFSDSEQGVDLSDRFEQECLLLSRQRHPNIVLFMGVFFKKNSVFPALIMEELTVSLDRALEKYKIIPNCTKNVILYDIACGLSYLHGQNPPVIHRDLSSKNVLLSENLRAKIADLGVARIMYDTTRLSQEKLTQVPGTSIFMPPEALPDNPKYDRSLDMFSYGNLILNVVNQKWPRPTAIATNNLVLVSEIDRRKRDLDEMGESHSLRDFTIRCLDNMPTNRPDASLAVERLGQEVKKQPPPFLDALQMMDHISLLADEITKKDNEVKSLQASCEALQKESDANKNKNFRLETELAGTNEEKMLIKKSLDHKNMEVENLNEEKNSKETIIHFKENTIAALKTENNALKDGNKVSLLQSTASLNWKQCSTLPHPCKHVQAVEFEGKVYIGSGYSSTDALSHQIFCYAPDTDQWKDGSESQTRYFAMTVFNDNLVLVGGISKENTFSKQVQHFTPDEKNWIFYESDEMPDMLEVRAGAIAVAFNFYLVVAGGYNSSRDRMDTVEVYERHSRMWFRVEKRIPRSCAELKTAVMCGDQLYLLGGANQYKDVFTTSLKQLVDKTVQPLMSDRKPSDASEDIAPNSDPWTVIAKLPYDFSFVSVFGGSLIALGGEREKFFGGTFYSTGIYVYNSHKEDWIHLADMPVGLAKATALTLSSGDMLIIGGRSKNGDMVDLMCKCKLVCSMGCTE